MDISIVIPNLNSPIIDLVVRSILAQEINLSVEVIVVGMDKSGLIPKDPRVIEIRTEEVTPAGLARNIGVEASRGDLIVFIDADCIVSKEMLVQHVIVHERLPSSLVGGSVLFPREGYLHVCDNVSTFHAYMPHLPESKRRVVPSLNMSLQRTTWKLLNGFDPRYRFTGEDTDFTDRARHLGITVVFSPLPKVTHHHGRMGLKAVLNHAFRFGQDTLIFNFLDNDQVSLARRAIFAIGSPMVALVIVIKILFHSKLPIRYWHTLPMVYIAKMAWSLGVAFRHS